MSIGMHARETADVVAALRVDPQRGLPAGEAVRRSIHFGANIAARTTRRWPAVARILCDGEETLVRASVLVPGDVIIVESGSDIPADARIVAAAGLVVDECELTGANVPVVKSASTVADADPLSERTSMLYLGTRVIAGRATAIVTAIGDATEFAHRS